MRLPQRLLVAGQQHLGVQPIGAEIMGEDPHLQPPAEIEDTAQGPLLPVGRDGVVTGVAGIDHAPVATAVASDQTLQGLGIHPLAYLRTNVHRADGEAGSHDMSLLSV